MHRLGIVGAGTMGQGIAETVAGKGFDVILIDKTERDLEEAKLGLEISLSKRLTKWAITEAEKKSTLSRIMLSTDLSLLKDCNLVIETVWEVLEDKIEVLQQIEAVVSQETVIATNTSTLSITEIGAQAQAPERVIGVHFHYPPQQREVVEVVRGLKTSMRTNDLTYQFLRELGKTPVRVFESPGFITSRLMMPLINEAVMILAEGVATADDIDLAMKAGYGFNMGPLELADAFGLDSCVDMLEALFEDTADPRYRPTAYLRRMVRGGLLGKKTREGFFRYNELGDRIPSGETAEGSDA